MSFSHSFTLPKRTASLTKLCFFRTHKTGLRQLRRLSVVLVAEDKQSEWAFSPLKFLGTYLLLEDFRSRSWAEGGGSGSPASKKQHTGLLNLTDDSDLRSSGIFQAGCRCRRGGNVSTAHVTQLHFQVQSAELLESIPIFYH